VNPLDIRPLQAADRSAWAPLAEGYKAFYKTSTTPAEYDLAFQRLIEGREIFGLGAWSGGELLGIAHYLFHASPWAPGGACYLNDLFTVQAARGQGVGRALINAVADQARAHGCARYYWLTQDHNTTARTLYDKVGQHVGFIRYDMAL
jgi:GNAT superfamily N-acetyltransferase